MKKKYINPTAQAIQLEINPLLDNPYSVQNYDEQTEDPVAGDTGGNQGGGSGSKGFSISNDGPEYDEEL